MCLWRGDFSLYLLLLYTRGRLEGSATDPLEGSIKRQYVSPTQRLTPRSRGYGSGWGIPLEQILLANSEVPDFCLTQASWKAKRLPKASSRNPVLEHRSRFANSIRPFFALHTEVIKAPLCNL